MDYRRIYMKIIFNAIKETKQSLRPLPYKRRQKAFSEKYFEFHHILPKSLFPLWRKRESNIIALTAREHFFCHQLLTKIYPSREMFYALRMMAMANEKSNHKEHYKISSKEYETLRKNNPCKGRTPWNKGLKMDDEVKQRMTETRAKTISNMTEEERKRFCPNNGNKGTNNPFYNKKHSQETLDKISKTLKEKNSKLTKEQLSQKFGHCHLTGESNPRAHAVMLLNTGEIFNCIADAKRKYPQARHITECCQGHLGSTGKLDGEKMRWAYVNKD